MRSSAAKLAPSVVTITAAEEQDFEAIQCIYAAYVLNTTVSLEDEPPSVEEMKHRWQKSREKNLPYLVAKVDSAVAGYAYAVPYRQRTAYRFTVEESVYMADRFRGMGIGQKLMEALVEDCAAKGYKQMIAVIAGSDNIPSIKFHEALGFVHAGTLRGAGFKFDRWIDTVRMQREL